MERPESVERAEAVSNTDAAKQQDVEQNKEKKLNKKDVENITDGLNDFMQSINTDIRFVLHPKLEELMVQVVDTHSNKVLRESPPKEILDTLARIRDFVGALLDKKV
jgi:flagellar protein FlaG